MILRVTYMLFVGFVLVCGCAEVPGEKLTGKLTGTAFETPLSKSPACVARVIGSKSYGSGRSTTSIVSGAPRWAPDAALEIDGTPVKLRGLFGSPRPLQSGEQWLWSKGGEVPKSLLGWGVDGELTSLNNPNVRSTTFAVSLTEEYATCGDTITLQGIREGNQIELVDRNATDGSNALAMFVGVVAGVLCLLVFPLVLLIAFVVRRSRRAAKT